MIANDLVIDCKGSTWTSVLLPLSTPKVTRPLLPSYNKKIYNAKIQMPWKLENTTGRNQGRLRGAANILGTCNGRKFAHTILNHAIAKKFKKKRRKKRKILSPSSPHPQLPQKTQPQQSLPLCPGGKLNMATVLALVMWANTSVKFHTTVNISILVLYPVSNWTTTGTSGKIREEKRS